MTSIEYSMETEHGQHMTSIEYSDTWTAHDKHRIF